MTILEERLDKLEKKIKDPSFRQNRGVSNEVKYYIFDYPSADELLVRQRVDYLRQKSESASSDFLIQVFDLRYSKTKADLSRALNLKRTRASKKSATAYPVF